ncbi:hypothetical protein Clacol_007919 [Clathrus columnatus]|uniref:Peptidase A1 domain-containing protein n=1 Tax=Clathrus columnatus TaxID=1419009 RepID=A0AAV5ALU7_9AGAM|nr:hypothetical protein Clacol_007919 [Clathrus columnatus]
MSTAVVPLVKHANRPSGPAAYARAVRKYNLETAVFIGHHGAVYKRNELAKDAHKKKHHGHYHLRDLITAVRDRPSEDSVTVVNTKDIAQDSEYVVEVIIGEPGVKLTLQFDTGSSDLWVWSTEISHQLLEKAGRALYDPSHSKTSKRVEGSMFLIGYGDGSNASGDVYTDTLRIGNLVIPDQAIEAAKKVSSSFMNENDSGQVYLFIASIPDILLGLGFSSINTVKPTPVQTPVGNLIDRHIAPGIFSVALDKGDDRGFYTFGGIDAAKAGVSESSRGFWLFDSATAVINGATVSLQGNQAILDTGTTLALVSEELTQEIYKHVHGATLSQEYGGWIYPKGAKLPEVKLAVGEHLFTLNPADFTMGDIDDETEFGGIQSRGNNPFDILGDVFLKSIYAVFDQQNNRVGVAQRTSNVTH